MTSKLIIIGIILIVSVIILTVSKNEIEAFETATSDNCPTTISYVDADIPGHNMHYLPIKDTTEENCAKACKEAGCLWYNFNTNTHKCWIKQGTPKNRYVTGFKIPGATDTSACGTYYYVQNMDIPGHKSIPAPFINLTESECRDKCNLHICDWYNYDITNKKCWIKKKLPKAGVKTVINLQ